jgi:type II secretory pathway pseudopilin PulG
MIEILVVVGIIAILVGILIPAVAMVQKTAKEVKQKAQFTAIDLGLAAFRSDYGDYPPSFWWDPGMPSGPQNYCGAQKLAEAMLGWDLLGFHPNSAWRADGMDSTGGLTAYSPPIPTQANLSERKSRYLEMDTANVFRLGESGAPGVVDGLWVDPAPLARSTYVLCDVFDVPERKLQLSDGKSVSPGTPILYYKANPASKTLTALEYIDRIYNSRDNVPLISLRKLADWAKPLDARRPHPIGATTSGGQPYFYEYIRDPKMAQNLPWPYRPDSYLLISAGADGLYGTNDDIRNFGKK